MKMLFVFFINSYQRYISPYKNFRCAHAVLHQGDSCSEACKKLIQQQGFLRSLPLIQQRFFACSEAYQLLSKQDDEEKDKESCTSRSCREACDSAVNESCNAACNIPKLLPNDCHVPCDCGFIRWHSLRNQKTR